MKYIVTRLALLIALSMIHVSLTASPQSDVKGRTEVDQMMDQLDATTAAIVERTINELEEEGRRATLKNDVQATERLLADDWMNTNANGSVTTKPQLIGLLKSTPFNFLSIEDDEVKIRTYEGSAVVTGRSVRKRSGQDGKAIAQQFRFTRVYVKRDGRWQVVAAQSTPILQP